MRGLAVVFGAMHAHVRSVAVALVFTLLAPTTGCLTAMEPSVVPVTGEPANVSAAVRRTLVAEGHEIDSTDVDAGIVDTSWKASGSSGERSLVYRYVVIHQDDTVRVSAQLQNKGVTNLGDRLQGVVAG